MRKGNVLSSHFKASDGVTRRSFMQAAGMLVGASALAGCSGGDNDTEIITIEAEPREKEIIKRVACRPNCHNFCYLNAHIRNGKLVKVSPRDMPDTDYNRVCLRGLSHPQRIYSPDRILQPLRRVAGTNRGDGQYETISWETAVQEISDKIKAIQNEYGNSAMINYGQSGDQSMLHNISRLAGYLGMSSANTGIDWSYVYAHGRVLGMDLHFPTIAGNEPADMKNAKTIINWGGNVVDAQAQNWHFIADAMEHNGAKLIVVDPTLSTTAARADYFVHIRPATDAKLALSLLDETMKHDDPSAPD